MGYIPPLILLNSILYYSFSKQNILSHGKWTNLYIAVNQFRTSRMLPRHPIIEVNRGFKPKQMVAPKFFNKAVWNFNNLYKFLQNRIPTKFKEKFKIFIRWLQYHTIQAITVFTPSYTNTLLHDYYKNECNTKLKEQSSHDDCRQKLKLKTEQAVVIFGYSKCFILKYVNCLFTLIWCKTYIGTDIATDNVSLNTTSYHVVDDSHKFTPHSNLLIEIFTSKNTKIIVKLFS